MPRVVHELRDGRVRRDRLSDAQRRVVPRFGGGDAVALAGRRYGGDAGSGILAGCGRWWCVRVRRRGLLRVDGCDRVAVAGRRYGGDADGPRLLAGCGRWWGVRVRRRGLLRVDGCDRVAVAGRRYG